MDATTALPAKRMGRPPKVTRDDILAAAARADLDELQLTRVAQELGISVKTVYYYFPTRRALIDALTEQAVDRMGLPEVEGAADWRQVLEEVARWSYRLGRDQPGWFADPVSPRGLGLELMRRVLARLAALGWSPRDGLRACMVVGNWAAAAGEAAARTIAAGGLDPDNVRRHLEDFGEPETVERLGALVSSFTMEEAFEDGLATVLAGVEARMGAG